MKNNELNEIVMLVQLDKEKNFVLLHKAIYKTLIQLAYNITNNHNDTQDIVQETLLAIYAKVESLNNKEAFNSWMKSILVYKCMDHFRKNNINFIDYDEYNKDVEVYVMNEKQLAIPDVIYKNKEKQEVIMRMISELPLASRITIVMHYFEEMKLHEIAVILDVSEQVVKNRLFYGRKLLKDAALKYEKEHKTKLYSTTMFASLAYIKSSYNKTIKIPKLKTNPSIGSVLVVVAVAISSIMVIAVAVSGLSNRFNLNENQAVKDIVVKEEVKKGSKYTSYNPNLSTLASIINTKGEDYLLADKYDDVSFNKFIKDSQLEVYSNNNITIYYKIKWQKAIYLCVIDSKIYYKVIENKPDYTEEEILNIIIH